jgi:hypothetical protein
MNIRRLPALRLIGLRRDDQHEPQRDRSPERGGADLRDLRVLMRLHAGDSNRSYDGAISHQRQSTFERKQVRHGENAQVQPALFKRMLESDRWSSERGGCLRLLLRDFYAAGLRLIEALKKHGLTSVVDDGDDHRPATFDRGSFRCIHNAPCVCKTERRPIKRGESFH